MSKLFWVRVRIGLAIAAGPTPINIMKGLEMSARERLMTFALPLAIIVGTCGGAWADDSGRGDDHGKPRGDDKNSHYVFLPVGLLPATATTPGPNNPCLQNGCIAVYRVQAEHSDNDVVQR